MGRIYAEVNCPYLATRLPARINRRRLNLEREWGKVFEPVKVGLRLTPVRHGPQGCVLPQTARPPSLPLLVRSSGQYLPGPLPKMR